MATNDIGIAFAPTFDNAQMAKRAGQVAAPAGAIQTLNFRLPKITGQASAHALSPLVGQDRAGVSFGGAVLQSVFRTVLGVDTADTLFGSSSAASAGDNDRDRGSDVLQALSRSRGPTTTDGTRRDWTTPRPPVFVPGSVDGGPGGPPQMPGPWFDPRPSFPEPAAPAAPGLGFGAGHGAGVEDASDSSTWMSPWERQHGRYGG